MTIEIQESLLTAIYNLLTTDATLITAMGGSVRLFLTWAVPDAVFPYLVHRIDMRPPDWSPVDICTYILDIWSASSNATEIVAIKKRIMELLDGRQSSTAETSGYWLWRQTDGFVPESTEGIWHYSCQFNFRYIRDAQIGALLKR